jgi:hypothetical protein
LLFNFDESGTKASIGPMASTPQHPDKNVLPWHASPPIAPGCRSLSDEQRLIHAMIDLLARNSPSSDAEALKCLRRGYPESSLAVRTAALAACFRFNADPGAQPMRYMPR